MLTGNGLDISIKCNYLPHHHWMAFASWYSIYKNLPDAHVKIICDKSIKLIDQELFAWTSKLKIEFSYCNRISDLEIFCDIMAIREWNSDKVCEASSEDVATFCTYKNGCGNFVMDEWINNIVPPFFKVDDFKIEKMTVNEVKILELWKKSQLVYIAMG